jgi:pimeloyl-ACP methyl ester carboxylesterase
MRPRSAIFAVGALLALVACSTSPSVTVGPAPTEATSTTAPSTDSADPAKAGETVDWGSCEKNDKYTVAGWQCGSITVPLDYRTPSKGTVMIALTRKPATDPATRIGSLVVNPGGPGGSGIETVHFLTEQLPDELTARFDLVGFDPRGVGDSTAVDCISDDQKDAEANLDPTPNNPADVTALATSLATTGRGCAPQSDLLAELGTMNSARDLDRIRQAVGDEKLTFLGFSYGTRLGATYADLFPDRVRALVLDGVVDPTKGVDSSGVSDATGYGDQDFEAAFGRFAAACKAAPTCPARPDPKHLHDQVQAAVEKAPVHAATIEGEDGRKLTKGLFEAAVGSALYDASSWPFLAVGLKDAAAGDGSALIRLADNYNGRNLDGTWTNFLEAFRAITCADFADRPTVAEVQQAYAKNPPGHDLPSDGPQVACLGWPATAEPASTITKADTPPLLLVGTKGDPATPYANTAAMAQALGNGLVLTWDGDGHTAFPKTDCITKAVSRYLVDLLTPAVGTTCPATDGGTAASAPGSAYALDRADLRRQIEEGLKTSGAPATLATCVAKPIAGDLSERELVHFYLGLDQAGLTKKLAQFAAACGGSFGK